MRIRQLVARMAMPIPVGQFMIPSISPSVGVRMGEQNPQTEHCVVRGHTLITQGPGNMIPIMMPVFARTGEPFPQMKQPVVKGAMPIMIIAGLMITWILTIAAVIAYTLLYIKRIKRQQRETMEAYLAILEVRGEKLEVRSER